MFTRLMIPAVLSAAMLSTPVLAGSADGTATPPTPAAQTQTASAKGTLAECGALEKQVSVAVMHNEHGFDAAYARGLAADGTRLCDSGNYDQGVAKLRSAMSYILSGE